jgi:hypothetical protein
MECRLTAVATALSLLVVTGASAQDAISVTFILVPERTACRPNGYVAGEDDQDCRTLTLPTVKKWAGDWPSFKTMLKPNDNEIALTQNFSQKLHSLVRGCWPTSARKRWAMVLWIHGLRGNSVHIERTSSGSSCEADGYSRTTEVSTDRNAINHQRADVFRPAMDAEWSFKAGRVTYRLTLAKPRR